MSKLMTGFDIGEASLKIVQSSQGVIKKSFNVELPENMVEGDNIVSKDAMADFIRSCTKGAGLSRGDAAIVLPASKTFVKTVTVPVMSREQLNFNLPYEFKDYLTEEKSKYVFDYAILEVIDGPDGEPYEMRLLACAALAQTLEEYRKMFARAGYKLKVALPAECAYVNLIAHTPSAHDKDICIVDIGHSETAIYIFHKGEYSARRLVTMGMANLEGIIALKEDVDIHMARNYKQSNYNDCITSQDAMDLYSNMAVEITKAVNFFNYSNPDAELHDIYLFGGGAKIVPLAEAIAAESRMDVHKAAELFPPLASAKSPASMLDAYASSIISAKQPKVKDFKQPKQNAKSKKALSAKDAKKKNAERDAGSESKSAFTTPEVGADFGGAGFDAGIGGAGIGADLGDMSASAGVQAAAGAAKMADAAKKSANAKKKKVNKDAYLKHSINLMNCGLPKHTGAVLSVGVVLIAILVICVIKFGVVDQYSKLSTAEDSYNQIHEQNVALDEKLVDYDEVAIQYRAYSKNMVDSTNSNGETESIVMVDRQDILDLIEKRMMWRGNIESISITDNTCVVSMSGMNLEQISQMNESLKKSDLVSSVVLKVAQSEANGTGSVLTFTDTIYLVAESEVTGTSDETSDDSTTIADVKGFTAVTGN